MTAGIIGVDSEASILNGEFQVVFTAPEMLFKKQWRNMLMSDIYAARLRAFVIDEAHTCKTWYEVYNYTLLLSHMYISGVTHFEKCSQG